ncbi:hypothetical protein ACWDO6_31595 [Streptomyces sp. NPDC003674]|uniref:hypothetical protein n=1 Tax=unclassified Streptomyces TaxID=2593676 RepID=UPI001174E7DF|nr:hypothetical protein [Streptomyces sp. 1-11]GEJ99988.1 hypothetical protein TNCT1_22650 [Streptomyces sp. 1-11]
MSAPTAPDPDDTPAVALGPIALVLGIIAAPGVWPGLMFIVMPWSWLAGAFAVTSGLAGIHYARQGIGRMWPAVAGTVLGALGLSGFFVLLAMFSG